jgi:hypothetical protein
VIAGLALTVAIANGSVLVLCRAMLKQNILPFLRSWAETGEIIWESLRCGRGLAARRPGRPAVF